LRLIQAILQGVRAPHRLLECCDVQIVTRKRAALLKAFKGNWQAAHRFTLRQAYEGWQFYQQQIAAGDREISAVLTELAASAPPGDAPVGAAPTKRLQHNAPQIADLPKLLRRLTGGQDLGALPALSDYSVLQLLSEVGTDMSRWPTVKHFTAWLGLAPSSRRSGKRRRREKRFRNPAGQIFCVVARSLARSKHLALGGFYRPLRAMYGAQLANIATARKVAVLFYNTLRYGLAYVEQGLQNYAVAYRHQSLRRLERNARQFGLILLPAITANA
jgi:transposase